jgi:NADPH2:quinone reductase
MRRIAVPPATPAPGESLIEVRLAPVSYVDYLMVTGGYQRLPELPFTPGLEVMGEADGKRVIALTKSSAGGLATFALADPHMTFRVPDDVPDTTAAACLTGYQTAYHAVHERAHIRAGERVLVTGAAGVVGSSVCCLAMLAGARVIAVVSSAEKAEAARAAGAHQVVLTSACVADEVGDTVDVIVDVVGGTAFEQGVRLLARNGRLLVVGFTSGDIPSIRANQLMLRSAAVVGVNWGMTLRAEPAAGGRIHAALMQLASSGQLYVGGHTVAFGDAACAVDAMGQRTVTGRQYVAVAS